MGGSVCGPLNIYAEHSFAALIALLNLLPCLSPCWCAATDMSQLSLDRVVRLCLCREGEKNYENAKVRCCFWNFAGWMSVDFLNTMGGWKPIQASTWGAFEFVSVHINKAHSYFCVLHLLFSSSLFLSKRKKIVFLRFLSWILNKLVRMGIR